MPPPFGPTRATRSPGSIRMDTSRSTGDAPLVLEAEIGGLQRLRAGKVGTGAGARCRAPAWVSPTRRAIEAGLDRVRQPDARVVHRDRGAFGDGRG